MYVFLALIAVALLVSGPIAITVALVQRRDLSRLRAQNRILADRLARVESAVGSGAVAAEPMTPSIAPGVVAPTLVTPAPVTPEIPAERGARRPAAPPVTPAFQPSREPKAPGTDLESIIGGRWLTWVGILAIFFGTAFFLAYDLGSHALAGTGQLVVGIIVGALFVAIGVALTPRRQRVLGQGLLGGGIALLYLTAYAAYGFHHLVPALVVYPFLLGVAALGAVAAIRLDSVAVAVLTLMGALLTPPLMQPDSDPGRVLFPYLVAVNAGTAAIALVRRWPVLPLGGFLGTVLLIAIWWDGYFDPTRRGLVTSAVCALWLIYAALPFASRVKRGFWSVARAVVVTLNGLAMAGFVHAVLHPGFENLRGVVIAFLALGYVAIARAGSLRGGSPAVTLTFYTGVALAVIAVPIQFDAGWTTLSWGALGLVLFWSGIQLPSGSHRAAGLIVLFCAVFRVVSFDLVQAAGTSRPETPVFNIPFLIGLFVVAAVALAARLLRTRGHVSTLERSLVTPLVMVAAAALWLRLSGESYGSFAAREKITGRPGSLRLASLLTLSLVWAVYAGLLIAAGFVARYRAIRFLGVVVLGVLVVKVFLLDMQALDRGYRIASFVGVGLLLLVISIIYQKDRRK